jgi:hypothetical protein
MDSITKSTGWSAHRIQQAIKWAVYLLLLVNFGYYIYEDWTRALHTLTAESTLADWAAEFATSIDEAAWFALLFMFELETYVLEDEAWKGWTARVVHGVRLVCYAMLAHTVYAYSVAVIDLNEIVPVENATTLCALADSDVSYVYNLGYTDVNEETCSQLSGANQFFWVAGDPVVTDADGLALELKLAWTDVAEAIIWLLIVGLIELVVRLQEKGVTTGRLLSAANRLKPVLYLLLMAIAAYWGTLSHWVYVWDEFMWIAGFAAIEMNVSEWRDEIEKERDVSA